MARPWPTLLLVPFALPAFHCSLDERALHAAGGSAAGGGAGGTRQGSDGGAAIVTGGSIAEAGADPAAGASGSGSEPAQGTTGAPCFADPDCRAADGGPGRCLERWPGGYCSSPCVEFPDCAGNDATLCRNVEGEARCLVACFGPLDCRAGYTCAPDLFGCVPK